MNLHINADTALMRGVRTLVQGIIGLIAGLLLAVWNVPGVPETIHSYVSSHAVQLGLTIGLPAAISGGVAAFVWNYFRKDVQNV